MMSQPGGTPMRKGSKSVNKESGEGRKREGTLYKYNYVRVHGVCEGVSVSASVCVCVCVCARACV